MTTRRLARATVVVAFALLFCPTVGIPDPPESILDRSRDQILERKPVTSRGRVHGEVRVIRRGDAVVIQTLLSSKVLDRVVANIRDRELESWPPGSEGHAAALAYVEALEAAANASPPRDRRRQLLIEFILSATTHGVVIARPNLREGPEGELSLHGVEAEQSLDLPRRFVDRDMMLIAGDRGLTLPGP